MNYRQEPKQDEDHYYNRGNDGYNGMEIDDDDRELFDSLVQEEMSKLENEFRSKVRAESYDDDYQDDESTGRNYQPQQGKSANGRPRSNSNQNPIESLNNRRQPNEHQPSSRHFDIGESSLNKIGNVTDDRRKKFESQQKYASELQNQQNTKRNLVQFEKDREPSVDYFTGMTGNPSRTKYQPVEDPEKAEARRKKMEAQRLYAAELQKQQNVKSQAFEQEEQRTHYKPVKARGYEADIPDTFQIGGSTDMDKAKKIEAQHRYFEQLQEQQYQTINSGSSITQSDRRAQSTGRIRPKQPYDNNESNFSNPLFGEHSPSKAEEREIKRRSQQLYAQQIREASEGKPVESPRAPLRRRQSPREQEESRTTLILPNSEINTREQMYIKRNSQEQYREQLNRDRNIKPVENERVSKVQRNSHEVDITSAGLIGYHETASRQKQKKLASQELYRKQLDQEVATKSSSSGYGVPNRQQQQQQQQERSSSPYVRGNSQPSAMSNVNEVERERRHSGYDQDLDYLMHEAARHIPASRDHYSQPNDDEEYYNERYNERSRVPSGGANRQNNYSYQQEQVANDLLRRSASPVQVEEYQKLIQSPRRPNSHDSQTKVIALGSQAPKRNEAKELTGLMIGGMNVITAEERERKARNQRKYAEDIAAEAAKQPFPVNRQTIEERNRYLGNGLPGEYKIRGKSSGGGKSNIF